MNKLIVLVLLAAGASAQSQVLNDAERRRISNERTLLDAAFSREDAACYQKFLVNNCLNDVKLRRTDALADLRRQEISLNDRERKTKGAEQVQKTEDKDSPEKQQQAADKRTEARKDFDDRMAREQQKNETRAASGENEKAKLAGAKSRIKNARDRQVSRSAKQASTIDSVNKYKERQEKSQERQARLAREKASQTKPPAEPLPVPN